MEVTIYTRVAACPYCEKAKQLLLDNDLQYTEVVLKTPEQKADTVSMIKEQYGVDIATVPQIIMDGHYVGGYTELVSWFATRQTEDALDGFNEFAL